ncbi:hypothetical protein [Geodermatophilus sp. SYSU D01176]
MTNLIKTLSPPPMILPVAVARDLAGLSWMLPCEALYAVREVLFAAIKRAEGELRDWPRRRGNAAKRARVEGDYGCTSEIRDELVSRRCCSALGPLDKCAAGPVPELGTEQWMFVAANGVAWSGTAAQLFGVARAVTPGEKPVDWAAWRAWSRRERWTLAASSARFEAQLRREEADRALEDAEHLMRQAADRQHRGREAGLEATGHERVAAAHQWALELEDDALSGYEAALWGGATPAEALEAARRNPA